jgi:NADH dehydrogenase [ubiquinone] 1 alpha subcomplex assembly factor 4
MGKILSVIQRKVNRFNVENRAHRVISKDKPTAAPKHASTIQELEIMKSG